MGNDIKKREGVISDWNETLTSINSKITDLEDDKASNENFLQLFNSQKLILVLQKERNDLLIELNNSRTLYKESENLNQLLQGKCEYSERLAEQLERENRILEELREENHELQQTIDRLKDKAEKLTYDVSETVDQQERSFLNEVSSLMSILILN